jgi:translation initiation factor IF-3
LVGPEGEQVGIVPLERALQLAADVDLDLVEVAPLARPPVCKLMDYGKYKYETALKAREARRNQQQTVIKEMKLRPKIDSHDYETKKGHVVRFLKAGDKVKVTIMFRGREQSRPELGFRLLRRLSEEVADLGFVESAPKQDGRNMIMVIAPHRSTKAAAAKAVASTSRDAPLPTRPREAAVATARETVAPAASPEAAVATPAREPSVASAARDGVGRDTATRDGAANATSRDTAAAKAARDAAAASAARDGAPTTAGRTGPSRAGVPRDPALAAPKPGPSRAARSTGDQ